MSAREQTQRIKAAMRALLAADKTNVYGVTGEPVPRVGYCGLSGSPEK